jgi:protein-L-isoaspartate O-methyltransferase
LVPEPLLRQLAPGGRLVMPVGEAHGAQRLLRLRKLADDQFEEEELGSVAFVPLVGGADSG